MPMLFSKACHGSCANIQEYLHYGSKEERRTKMLEQGDMHAPGIESYLHNGHNAEHDRALFSDFVGFQEWQQKNWAYHMDKTREYFGSDSRTGEKTEKRAPIITLRSLPILKMELVLKLCGNTPKNG